MPSKLELKIKAGSTTYSLLDVCPLCGIYEPDGAVCNICKTKYDDTIANLEMTRLLAYTKNSKG